MILKRITGEIVDELVVIFKIWMGMSQTAIHSSKKEKKMKAFAQLVKDLSLEDAENSSKNV